MDYGDFPYNETDKTQTKKLQTLQNRSIRIAHNLTNRTNVDALHGKHKLPHAEIRRILHLQQYMHSIASSSELVDTRSLNTQLHDVPVFIQPMPKSSWFKKTFLYQGIQRWNQLPAELRSILDPISFKNAIKRKLLEEETLMYSQNQ